MLMMNSPVTKGKLGFINILTSSKVVNHEGVYLFVPQSKNVLTRLHQTQTIDSKVSNILVQTSTEEVRNYHLLEAQKLKAFAVR
jgi:hypothetical protein